MLPATYLKDAVEKLAKQFSLGRDTWYDLYKALEEFERDAEAYMEEPEDKYDEGYDDGYDEGKRDGRYEVEEQFSHFLLTLPEELTAEEKLEKILDNWD